MLQARLTRAEEHAQRLEKHTEGGLPPEALEQLKVARRVLRAVCSLRRN